MARRTSSSHTKSSGLSAFVGVCDINPVETRLLSDANAVATRLVSDVDAMDSGLKPREPRKSSIRRERASALMPVGGGVFAAIDGSAGPELTVFGGAVPAPRSQRLTVGVSS